jgi:hypothetical protein
MLRTQCRTVAQPQSWEHYSSHTHQPIKFDLGDSREYVDSGEYELVKANLNLLIRDLYISTPNRGSSGAYHKQCRIRHRAAVFCLLCQDDYPFGFEWTCRVLGFDPAVVRSRVLFDVDEVFQLLRSGLEFYHFERKPVVEADIWLWYECPEKYKWIVQADEEDGECSEPPDFVCLMSRADANAWRNSLEYSNFEYKIEQVDLTSNRTLLFVTI